MHFRGTAHPSIGTPCSLQGVKPYAIAPNCYTPDVAQLKSISTQTFNSLSSFVSTCTGGQAKILMGMLKSQAQLEKHDLFLFEKVYFSLGSGKVLSDYFAGFVMGLAPQSRVLIVGTQIFTNARQPVVAQMERSSLLNRQSFDKVAQRLSKEGKRNDLKPRKEIVIPPSVANYEPPTIESAQEILDANASVAPAKKKTVMMLEIRG